MPATTAVELPNSECHLPQDKIFGLLAVRVETDESNHMS